MRRPTNSDIANELISDEDVKSSKLSLDGQESTKRKSSLQLYIKHRCARDPEFAALVSKQASLDSNEMYLDLQRAAQEYEFDVLKPQLIGNGTKWFTWIVAEIDTYELKVDRGAGMWSLMGRFLSGPMVEGGTEPDAAMLMAIIADKERELGTEREARLHNDPDFDM